MWPAVLALLLFARAAMACDCFSSPECDGLGSQSAPTFRGTVLSISDLPSIRVARFRIEEAFGGLAPETQDVQYLVHARAGKSDGYFYTGICSGTRLVESAGAALRVLRQRIARQPIPSLIGRLTQRTPDFRDWRTEQPPQPLGATLIRLHARGKAFETRSDSDGIYTFYDLPAGRYEIEPDLPPAIKPAWSHVSGQPVELGGGACREYNLYLIPDSSDPLPLSDRLHRTSQRDGNYRFNKVPPGGYRILVNPDNRRDPDFAYARASYPVSVKPGEQVKGVDLRLQPLFVPRRLQVRITWANGRVIGDLVQVDARAVNGPQILARLQYPRAEKDVFEVKLVPDESYILTGKLICRYSDARSSGKTLENEQP